MAGALWITGPAPAKSLMAAFAVGYWSNMVYEKPDWDYKTFQLDAGLKAGRTENRGCPERGQCGPEALQGARRAS